METQKKKSTERTSRKMLFKGLICLTCVYLPVFAGASGVGRLVWVARVLRLVVHVSGRRWAGLTSPASSSSRRAALLADSSQLALALGDGLGGESEGQLEQVNLAPEGIYLGGWWGGSRRREEGRAGGGGYREERRRGVGEDGGQESRGRGELRWLWSEREKERWRLTLKYCDCFTSGCAVRISHTAVHISICSRLWCMWNDTSEWLTSKLHIHVNGHH